MSNIPHMKLVMQKLSQISPNKTTASSLLNTPIQMIQQNPTITLVSEDWNTH